MMSEHAITRPSRLLSLLEIRAGFDGVRLLPAAKSLSRAPRGNGRPVLLSPGYGASAISLWPLRRFLNVIGYSAYEWGQGRNKGKVEAYVSAQIERVAEISKYHGGEGVALVGWSLGGVVARESARRAPDFVSEVITMGTPVIGGPKYTSIGDFYARFEKLDLDEFEKEIHARNLLGIKCPIASIYSKSDGIVAWRASIDTYNPQAKNVEVRGSHLGLGVNPEVWLAVADILSENTIAQSKAA